MANLACRYDANDGIRMIEAQHITKRYGEKLAVDDLSFRVRPGIVTGFLGPNGAGKSTAMRLIIGLDAPTSGSVTVNGKRYRDHEAPLHEVGTMLEAHAITPGARPTTTCSRSPRRTASRPAASTR